jgi:hypothetical protein
MALVVPPSGGWGADRLKAELQTADGIEPDAGATKPANFLFFDLFLTMLLRSDFYMNDRARLRYLD